MCDLAPKDVVVCLRVGMLPIWDNISVGQCYTVAEVLHLPDALQFGEEPWGIQLSEVGPQEYTLGLVTYLGYDARYFRRVYRPDGSFISKLLEPVDTGAEVEG